MHALDGKPECCADRLQSFAGSKAFTDEIIALFFSNVLLGDGLWREGNAPIEAVEQSIRSDIQGG